MFFLFVNGPSGFIFVLVYIFLWVPVDGVDSNFGNFCSALFAVLCD